MNDAPDIRAAALASKAWPYEEARKMLKRWPEGKPAGDPVIFETGYGPSGLPHIGTWNEVARTTFVRHAYEELTGARPEDKATRMIAFSDDMDGLRKVPDNVPNQALLTENLGKPLTQIPDPFGTHESFAHLAVAGGQPNPRMGCVQRGKRQRNGHPATLPPREQKSNEFGRRIPADRRIGLESLAV